MTKVTTVSTIPIDSHEYVSFESSGDDLGHNKTILFGPYGNIYESESGNVLSIKNEKHKAYRYTRIG